MNDLRTDIFDTDQGASITAVALPAAREGWQAVLDALPYVPVAYTAPMVAYQQSYISAFMPMEALDVVLYYERKPVGVWPLLVRQTDGEWQPGSNEGPVLPPLLLPDLPAVTRKKLLRVCLAALTRLKENRPYASWQAVDSLVPGSMLTDWHELLMAGGAMLRMTHESYADLSLPFAALKSGFRKSYRALINSGRSLWQVNRVTSAAPDIWDEFRLLHQQVAGKVTRPIETWQAQYEALCRGAAFLVTLRDAGGRMVGGGFFQISGQEGLYAVAAYDRSLFDKPLGHVVQAEAIEYMQQLGLKWYRLGARPFPQDVPEPSKKELSIGEFKAGFATHMGIKLHYDMPPGDSSPNPNEVAA